MKALVKWLDAYFELVLGAIFLGIMVLFTFLQIIGRYVFPQPLPWTEEMTRYLFIWMTYIALGHAAKNDKHIRILFVRNRFSHKVRMAFDLFSDLVFLGFASVIAYYSVDLTAGIHHGGQTAVSLSWIPMWLVYLVMPLGFALVLIRVVQHIVKTLRAWNNPPEETAVGGEGL